MEQVLDQLKAFISLNPQRAFFEPPASSAAIDAVERAVGLALPRSYRAFLGRFNGGFINICNLSPDESHWTVTAARWNSNWLFGTNDLIKHYEKERSVGGWQRLEYMPICQTSGQELLVFFPREDGSEPPVLDAFHEASEWKVLYRDFPSMLQDYVEREGNIETIASG
jgi:hypothetical protein